MPSSQVAVPFTFHSSLSDFLRKTSTHSRYEMIGQGWTVLWVCLLVSSRSFVSTAPSRGAGLKDPADEEVRELEHLKSGNENSMSLVKSHSLVFSNIDGNKERHEGKKEEVDKNGQLVARMEQELDKIGRNEDHVKTVVDIPSRNIHRIFEHGPKAKSTENNAPRYRSFPGQRYSPVDMAEYIFWTGDERGATNAIEEFLEDGYMSRDQAIKFLEDIRMNLENLKGQYQGQVAPQRNELSDIRQQMRDSMSKKADYQEVDQTGLADEDYEELVDRLRMADLMYNEYSLEEVIYQLAKIMFKQSLTKGSVETQQALQEFTEFLESQAQEGKISQGMQKKVLDIVITSLSDTLTLHPELADTARKSLGLTPMNQGISEGQNNIPLNYQTSRFQEKEKNRAPMEKKSN